LTTSANKPECFDNFVTSGVFFFTLQHSDWRRQRFKSTRSPENDDNHGTMLLKEYKEAEIVLSFLSVWRFVDQPKSNELSKLPRRLRQSHYFLPRGLRHLPLTRKKDNLGQDFAD
jgi:hypothetical protein